MLNFDARVKNFDTAQPCVTNVKTPTDNLMLSIGRHVDFDARASKILTPPSQCENPNSVTHLVRIVEVDCASHVELARHEEAQRRVPGDGPGRPRRMLLQRVVDELQKLSRRLQHT